MNKDLTVTQTVELFETLTTTIEDFSARESTLNRELRTRMEATEKWHQNEVQARESRIASELGSMETGHATARDAMHARFERRSSRIKKALRSSQKQQSERIENAEGRLKYAVQKGTLDAERTRAEGLKKNDAALAEFQAQLATEEEAFGVLEKRGARALRGYGQFRRLLRGEGISAPDLSPDEYALLTRLRELHSGTTEDLTNFSKHLWARIFASLPLWLAIILVLCSSVGLIPALQYFGIKLRSAKESAVLGLLPLILLWIGYLYGRHQAKPLAIKIATALASARRMLEACREKARTRHAAEIQRLENGTKARLDALQTDWRAAVRQASASRESAPGNLAEKSQRITKKHEEMHQSRLKNLQRAHESDTARLTQERDSALRQLAEARQEKIDKWRGEYDAQWNQLEAGWKERTGKIFATIQLANDAADNHFPDWNSKSWETWTLPDSFLNAAKFGRLESDLAKFFNPGAGPSRLRLPGATTLSLPLVLTYPIQGSILFESTKPGGNAAVAALNNIIFRLLATTPAGKLSFTVIDPVNLGQNFAALTHLADYEENLLNGRIWTEPGQIEERLADLNEHMEKVIQMYLRNEYETIASYNLRAGNIAEKYHFVVIADFPAAFSESAIRRLLRIAASGARCGVYTLIHWDHRQTAPSGFFPEELRKSSVCVHVAGDACALALPAAPRSHVVPDRPPPPEVATAFVHRVGQASRGSNRVEVPFAQVAPPAGDFWTSNTAEELRVPIGRSGAAKLQNLAIGKGTRQHALVAGKTGSGKSTLFHVIITNLALWCSPENVEFYLIDFKKGVEFKCYATHRLPHARVVAIESDREFGLSVLERLDLELRRRGDLFRQAGVQDIAGYKRSGGTEPMPRSLLLIDEFQEFFVEDDRVSQGAAMLLDRIVRQGRAFGIHVVLGSQTLGGAYTLARTTIGQMVIRIALQCNEADAYLIMDENNSAPRLLSRPGEGIYNDMAGAVEGNSPFQAVWLPDQERDIWLDKIQSFAESKLASYPGPIVFEGNAPADIRENQLLRRFLENKSSKPPGPARIWLGSPNSIKGPTEIVFERRSGNNLLIVGQRDEAILTIISAALLALAAQYSPRSARFILFDASVPGSPEREYLERVVKSIPNEIILAKTGEIEEIMNRLTEDLKLRSERDDAPAPGAFIFIRGLQNFKKFRAEDEFSFSMENGQGPNPASLLNKLITEGPAHDIHVIATVDTFNNVNRFLGRKALSEFEMRVLFQMSANDSASLCDDPKASTLGLHRALLYNEHEGYIETFRPYALPGMDWINEAAGRLNHKD